MNVLGFEEKLAMGRTARSAQVDRAGEREARIAKAKRRRLELDKDKEARDARIDHAVADVYLALDERDDAAKLIEAAEAKTGAAIVRILAEGVVLAHVAELTELSVNQVQSSRRRRSSRRTRRRCWSSLGTLSLPELAVARSPRRNRRLSRAGRRSWCPDHDRTAHGKALAESGAYSDRDAAVSGEGDKPTAEATRPVG
jgi:hypothetical protein